MSRSTFRALGHNSPAACRCRPVTAGTCTKCDREMKRLLMAATLAATLLCSPQVSCRQESSEKMTIAHMMGAVWDKPDSSLKVDPIVIESDYAVVGWTQ